MAYDIRYGSRGDLVKCLQKKLNQLGLYLGRIDGIYGYWTRQAVINYQKKNGLVVDGWAGPITTKKLNLSCSTGSTVPESNPTVPESDGWFRSAPYDHVQQPDGMTCGPSSFAMVVDEQFGKDYAARTIANMMGGIGAGGTSHGMLRNVAKQFGLKVREFTTKQMTLKYLAEATAAKDRSIIFHEQCWTHSDKNKTTVYDYQGKLVWSSFRGGHYTYVSAVNPGRSLVLIDDPTKGGVYYKWSQILAAGSYTEQILGVGAFIEFYR